MKPDHYTITELLRNEEFISWVLNPAAVEDRRWEEAMERSTAAKRTIEAARGYVIVIAEDTGKNLPTPKQSQKMWDVVKSQLEEGKGT